MTTNSPRDKRQYQDAILRYMHENPQKFVNLATDQDDRALRGGQPIWRVGRSTPRPTTEAERAFALGVRSGFSFGLHDEIGAGWSSLDAMFDERDLGDVYDAELERLRTEAAYLQEQHPWAHGGGAVVGSAINPVSYLPVGWAARGAALAGNAGKLARFANTSHTMAKVDAIDGALYGFNDGEGGLESRLASAVEGGGLGMVGGAVAPVVGQTLVAGARMAPVAGRMVAGAARAVPMAGRALAAAGGSLATRGIERAINLMLDPASRRAIGKITPSPHEDDVLLEKARLMRRNTPGLRYADPREILTTAGDLAMKDGKRLTEEMRVMHQALHGLGMATPKVELTRPRANRVGAAYVGPGHVSEDGGRTLASPDKRFQYREPKKKAHSHPNNTAGFQANLEREFRRMRRYPEYYNNLHVNITGMAP
jgi:hypothetical protein